MNKDFLHNSYLASFDLSSFFLHDMLLKDNFKAQIELIFDEILQTEKQLSHRSFLRYVTFKKAYTSKYTSIYHAWFVCPVTINWTTNIVSLVLSAMQTNSF